MSKGTFTMQRGRVFAFDVLEKELKSFDGTKWNLWWHIFYKNDIDNAAHLFTVDESGNTADLQPMKRPRNDFSLSGSCSQLIAVGRADLKKAQGL